jgi:hypothetical protein
VDDPKEPSEYWDVIRSLHERGRPKANIVEIFLRAVLSVSLKVDHDREQAEKALEEAKSLPDDQPTAPPSP